MNDSDTKPPLGKPVEYGQPYSPDLLHGIPRADGRASLRIGETPPFSGVDIWTAYELSWLSLQGKPQVATAELRFPADSKNLIESKSLKLYLNSLCETRHEDADAVAVIVTRDLARASGAPVEVSISGPTENAPATAHPLGVCLDGLEPQYRGGNLDPELMAGSCDSNASTDESLYTHLFKSNCPVTGQPDWATVSIHYIGPRIDRERLLSYLVSYRQHAEFHEQCVERIFSDLTHHCRPEALTVYARYTRRGGLDINPFRSNFEEAPENLKVWRQ